MRGFLFDQNLPRRIRFKPSFPIEHVTVLGKEPSDHQIWEYARDKDFVIVTKDADFSDRIFTQSAPPRVIHLKFGNMRRDEFHKFLQMVWPRVESLILQHKNPAKPSMEPHPSPS
jgi:predicted nuclease of predicted toxin-antitoxin system